MLDCTDVSKSVENEVGERKNLVLLALLIQWHLDYLEKIQNESRDQFPKEQGKILFEKIETNVKKLKADLIRLDIKDLKFIGIILLDYKLAVDVNFKKFLIKSLLLSYKSISEVDVINVKLNYKDLLQVLKEYFQDKDNQIKLNLDSSTKGKINEYLNVRRDAHSLHKIYSTIDLFEKSLKGKKISFPNSIPYYW